MELWELAAREHIRDTIARYTHAGDRGLAKEVAEQFVPTGTLEEHGMGTFVGRDAIAGFIAAIVDGFMSAAEAASESPRVRHYVTSLCLNKLTKERAEMASYFVVFGRLGADHWGRYRDVLVPYEGRWLFEHRYVRVDNWVPAGMHAARTEGGVKASASE